MPLKNYAQLEHRSYKMRVEGEQPSIKEYNALVAVLLGWVGRLADAFLFRDSSPWHPTG